MTPAAVVAALPGALTAELLREPYRSRVKQGAHPLTGHCYVASEVLYHLCGGKAAGLVPMCMQHEGGPHWWIRTADGVDVDPTAAQFSSPVPYELGRGKGFLTREPSRRARVVIGRVLDRMPVCSCTGGDAGAPVVTCHPGSAVLSMWAGGVYAGKTRRL